LRCSVPIAGHFATEILAATVRVSPSQRLPRSRRAKAAGAGPPPWPISTRCDARSPRPTVGTGTEGSGLGQSI
jgi:hypothetical protein